MTSSRSSRWRLVRGSAGGPGSARRFESRSRRWRLRALTPYLVLAGVAAAVAGLTWTVLGTTAFAAGTVRVEGATTVSADEVRRVAAVRADVPLARLDVDGIARRVRTIAPVAGARVTRSWPSAVTITITERTAVAVFARDDRWVLIDAAGVAFRTAAQRPAGLPLIAVKNPRPGDEPTLAALTVARDLSGELRQRITQITAPTSEQVTLQLSGGRTIFWGDAEDNARKTTVANVLLSRPGKQIDVSAPDVVTVR
ncbi:MAG: polypeptide-transport-associated protein [Actinomycetia bacterium]|jgi:cell division protein FtsQ|nr:polypeptide-transport-associated protein [Actinomycetes bacterium]MDQ1657149.1 cell division protein FtsQ [Cryptosporangiaceae bacterium]